MIEKRSSTTVFIEEEKTYGTIQG